MESKIFFNDSDGNKVCGILSTPVSETDIPLVILCHGLNSGKDSNTNVALDRIFGKEKIATFRFDFFAHGESEGNPKDRTVKHFVDDILNAISYLKSRGYDRLGIIGGSFGGLAAVIAASRSNDLCLIALNSPGMGKTSRDMPNYKNDFDTKSWIEAGGKIKIPVLIVHGSADQDVEVELGKALAESIKGSKIDIIEGADHRYTRPEDFEKSINLIYKFVVQNIYKGKSEL
jgi:hypothetical protein